MFIRIALCLLCLSSFAHAKLDGTKLSQEISLIGGRLVAQFPAKAKDVPRTPSIMAAAHTAVEETRVLYDDGPIRFVVMAYEAFARSEDLPADVKTLIKSWTPTPVIEVLAEKRIVIILGTKPKKPGEGNMLLSAYHRHPDGTVQLLQFYVNPKGVEDFEGAQKLAKQIALSLKPGKKMAKTPSPMLLKIREGQTLSIPIQENWSVTTRHGPDFLVFKVRTLPLLPQLESMGIYVGGHPSSMVKQGAKVSVSKGKLLDQAIEWSRWTDSGTHWAEVIVPLNEHERMHVFISAESVAQVDALIKVGQGMSKL